jgi:beta-mannosidase
VVNVGIWQDLRLVERGTVSFEHARVQAKVNDDLKAGRIRLIGTVAGGPANLRFRVTNDDGQIVASGEQACPAGPFNIRIPLEAVRLWWPATHGPQPRYHVRVELLDDSGRVSDALERSVGFRAVRWLDNPGAPAGAKPYHCEVNGVPLFLRGVNWVPLSPFYGTVSRNRYETFLKLYRNMNANILRVWGGAILETEDFYDLCDRLGLMVWQEFPLSSSGVENWPPEDPAVIEELQKLAAEYVERRGHHASHVLWCGGNELQGGLDGGKTGIGKPVDELHPLMLRWQELLAEIDPGKRFQASSPSGPSFYAHAANYGKVSHHQVHGPWGWGDVPFDTCCDYWNRDDSLFRSENGVPGCSSLAALERHRGGAALWPPRDTNRHWVVPAAAWIPWDDVAAAFGPIADEPGQLPAVVKAHRYMQAESYRYAAESCRRRYPACSGYIIWMGHDNLHNTANNSVLQIDGSAKPAYDWLQRAWAGRHVSIQYRSLACEPGECFVGRVFLHCDARPVSGGTARLSILSLEGRVLRTQSVETPGPDGAGRPALEVEWEIPAGDDPLFVAEAAWEAENETVVNRYLLSRRRPHPLAPLLQLAPAGVSMVRDSLERVTVRNNGPVAAVGVRVISSSAGHAVLADRNNLLLFPGESQVICSRMLPLEQDLPEPPGLTVEWFNGG